MNQINHYRYIVDANKPTELNYALNVASHRNKIENILNGNETEYKKIVNRSPEGIAIFSPEGCFIYVNKKFESMIGYKKEEIIGHIISKFIDNDQLSLIKNSMNQVENSEKFEIQCKFKRKDGSFLWTIAKYSPLYLDNDDNNPSIVLYTDITELKNAEKKVELASLYNRNLIEASLDPLVTIGPDGKVTDVNQATIKATGYSREEIIGSDFSNYFTQPEKANDGYKKVFKEGFVKDYPLEIQHQNGKITPVLYNASVYKDESGNIIGVFAAARDITEYKKAMNALRESEEKYRNIYEESFDGLFMTSPEGKILDMNKKGIEIFGYDSKEEIMDLDLETDIYADPKDRSKIIKTVNRDGSSQYEVIVKKKNQDRIITHCSLSAIEDHGKITSYRGIIRDITESKKAENAIIRAKEEWETHLTPCLISS